MRPPVAIPEADAHVMDELMLRHGEGHPAVLAEEIAVAKLLVAKKHE